jgi:hypothetical protein
MPRANPSTSACREFDALVRMNRRSVLTAGLGALLGAGLTNPFAKNSLSAESSGLASPAGFGRAKRCIFLFMWGGPSQLDTFDLKPAAPDNVRGPFKPVSTNVPGLQICEHFRELPAVMDKVAVIRSLGHDDPAHLSSGHATVTGHLAPVLKSDKDRRRRRYRRSSCCRGKLIIPQRPAAKPQGSTAVGSARRTTRCSSAAIPMRRTGKFPRCNCQTACRHNSSPIVIRCSRSWNRNAPRSIPRLLLPA